METRIVTDTVSMAAAYKARARHIVLEPPEGRSRDAFISDLVVHLKGLPETEGFDGYEVESIVRDMARPH